MKKAVSFIIRHRLFFICVFSALILAASYWLYEYQAKRPLRELKKIPVRALGCIPFDFTCPVTYYGTESPISRSNLRSIPVSRQIPGALAGMFLYDLKHKEIFLQVIWFVPTFRGGQFDYYYEITSQEVKEKLLNFIAKHEEDLQNEDLQCVMRCVLRDHEEELSELGDGDPYVGLERAGVADWIKEGKDPEAEWAKKFPADSGAQRK